MILYNVTVNIDTDVETDWINWMKSVHIPEVMKTGFFTEHRMMRVLSQGEGDTGMTYSIQYMAQTLSHLETYLNTVAPKIQKKSIVRYGIKMVVFRTVLEDV